jgi:DNA polymerase-3 subunit delta
VAHLKTDGSHRRRAIVDAANTLPFLSDVRLVVVKNVEKLGKSDSELLVSYLANPSPTTVMALVATKLAKSTRLYKAAAKVGPKAVIDCAPKSARELPALVQSMAKTHRATMDARAAAELVERIGDSTVQLDNEVRKLADIARARGDAQITEQDVIKLIPRLTDVKPWQFADALSDRDAHRCAVLISRMQDQSWTSLLASCVSRIRELIVAKAVESQGRGRSLLAEVQAINPRIRQDWQVKNHRRWAARFTAEELRDALDRAADAERQMKSGADQKLVFEIWVFETCGEDPRRR